MVWWWRWWLCTICAFDANVMALHFKLHAWFFSSLRSPCAQCHYTINAYYHSTRSESWKNVNYFAWICYWMWSGCSCNTKTSFIISSVLEKVEFYLHCLNDEIYEITEKGYANCEFCANFMSSFIYKMINEVKKTQQNFTTIADH